MTINNDLKKQKWIDISYGLSPKMVYWPNDPIVPRLDWVYSPYKNQGRDISMTQLNINVHNGTHIDAPRHLLPKGTPVDQMPLDAIMGPAKVIEITDRESIKVAELEQKNIQAGDRILFKTINSSYYSLGRFVPDFCYITTETATYLKDKRVSVVGIDYLAVGNYHDNENMIQVHQILVGNNIWVIEDLDLSQVNEGLYEIICLPIKIEEGDGAPARAIVRPLKV
jgi:arylformamidase